MESVHRVLMGVAIGLTGFVISLMPVTSAGAAGDPVVSIPADCGGPAFCFSPSSLTITDGDTVTWTNASSADHLVGRCDPASCDGAGGGSGTDAGFTSGSVPMGASFSHTFHGAGTYTYFCAIHGYAAMHGVIIVNAAPPSSTATTVAPTTAQPATTAAISGSTPESVAATTPGSTAGPQLAHTGGATGGRVAVGLAALVLGLAAWGVSTPRRGVVSRLRR
jgi:plastocyanin